MQGQHSRSSSGLSLIHIYRNRSTSTTNSKFKSGSFDAIKARDIILNAEKNLSLIHICTAAIHLPVSQEIGAAGHLLLYPEADGLHDILYIYKRQVLAAEAYSKVLSLIHI